jgi:hypothetical protein
MTTTAPDQQQQQVPTVLGNQPHHPRRAPAVAHGKQLARDDPKKQSRFWAVTINNPVSQFDALPEGCSYLVSGKEVGENGTPHLQMYVELTRSQRFSFLKKLFPTGHIEMRLPRSTGIQASDYCKKDGDFVEFGTLVKAAENGKRNDLVEVVENIKSGATLREIYEASPTTYMRNYRAIGHVRQMTYEPPAFRDNLVVRLYIGATRTGKSYHARVNEDCWPKPVGKGLWFDGYDRQKKVVIDEFRGQYPLSDFLQITDPYKVQVETKGGHTWFVPELVIITTNDHPNTMYMDHNLETRQAFYARFTEVWWWYAPRKYMVLSDQQRDAFFKDGAYPPIPSTATRQVVVPTLTRTLAKVSPPKLKRCNATLAEDLARPPPYRYDADTRRVVPAPPKKKARLSFIPETQEFPSPDKSSNDGWDEETLEDPQTDLEKDFESSHRYPTDVVVISSDEEISAQDEDLFSSVSDTEDDSGDAFGFE